MMSFVIHVWRRHVFRYSDSLPATVQSSESRYVIVTQEEELDLGGLFLESRTLHEVEIHQNRPS